MFFHAWGCAKRSSSDLITRTCSRPFLEWVVRGYLSSDRQVEFLSATQVKGLLTDASNSRVTGIKIFVGKLPKVENQTKLPD
ncbi:hypothetical protein [Fischerella thermalis]|uniref:hypothetical protein n=1 Tax=Fischerella thermalis TaxID=372787 RepID=UPI00241EC7A5|nr:hypothetical protein [Fischerella thermalis]